MVNSWRLIPSSVRELDPYGIILGRTIPPPPPVKPETPAPTTPAPTDAPTSAPTFATGNFLEVTDITAAGIAPGLQQHGVKWASDAFGVVVMAIEPCTDVAVRNSAATLLSFLDRDGDDVPDDSELMDALVANNVSPCAWQTCLTVPCVLL